MLKRLFSIGVATALLAGGAIAAVPANASTSSGKSPDSTVKVKVIAKDFTNNKKGIQTNNWLTIQIDGPEPIYSDAVSIPTYYSINVATSGSKCDLETSWSRGMALEGTYRIPLNQKHYNYSGYLNNEVTSSGKCDVKVTVASNRRSYVEKENGFYNRIPEAKTLTVVNTTSYVRSKTALSTPKASAKKVYKNKKATLRGVAKYEKANAKSFYKATAVKKGTKLVLQQKVKGSSKWKNVKTVKVGKKGKWATSVKVKKTTQYRVILKQTSTLKQDVSKATKVTVVKKRR